MAGRALGESGDVTAVLCSRSAFQDNTIDFLEFVAALNLVFRGDLEHKLRWSFKVYDRDNNGYVDRSELRSIIEVSSLGTVKKRF